MATAEAANVRAAKARRSVAPRDVANSLPPDVHAKVGSRAKLTPKVIGRAQSISADPAQPAAAAQPPAAEDTAEGSDERRRLRWIAHYVKQGQVQEALDLGWNGKAWTAPEMPLMMPHGAPEAHPVHGVIYNL